MQRRSCEQTHIELCLQAEQRWQDQLKAAATATDEQRQLTLAANRKIGKLDAALSASKDKLALQLSKTSDLEKQVSELRSQVAKAESNGGVLSDTVAKREDRIRALEADMKALQERHVDASSASKDQENRLREQVLLYPVKMQRTRSRWH